jgi:hypothetical protein
MGTQPTYRLNLWGAGATAEAFHIEREGIPKTAAEMLDKLIRVSTQIGAAVAIPEEVRIERGRIVESLTDLRINTAHIEQWAFTDESKGGEA